MLAQNTGLEVLDLSWNNFGKRGGVALSTGFKTNSTLQELNLSHNGLSDAGAAALAGQLSANRTLTKLNLAFNNIHDVGAAAVAAMLRTNRDLTHLDISNNPITSAGLASLVDALRTNTELQLVCLAGIAIDHATTKSLLELEALRPELRVEYDRTKVRVNDKEALADRLRLLEATASQRAVSARRRRSSIVLAVDANGNLVRKPLAPFNAQWSAEEAWLNGYNADGSIRADMHWLQAAVFDPSWSAAEAWQRGFHPDGTARTDAAWRQQCSEAREPLSTVPEDDANPADIDRRVARHTPSAGGFAISGGACRRCCSASRF